MLEPYALTHHSRVSYANNKMTAPHPCCLSMLFTYYHSYPFLILTLGEFLLPLIAYQIVPPIAPILNAPPASFKMTYGHGSLALSACAMVARVCERKALRARLSKVQQGEYGCRQGFT